MDNERLDPELLLSKIKEETANQNAGKLKIFFGYAAGVGKTYAMLEAAQVAKKSGVDVVLGYIEPHARPDTTALTNGIEVLPKKKVDYRGIVLDEFDLDAALQRKPQLILVDELAHTNAMGSRHPKRYNDIKELLRAGINVYTTVNVQHLESLNDMVSAITKIKVNERIPDKIFDGAKQVELVDIEPEELINRLHEGKVYRAKQAEQAVDHFFTVENLTALREIAMRRCADRMNRLRELELTKKDFYVSEHLLICLSSSPSNEKVIRTAARMANVYHGDFTALYVETPEQDGSDMMQDEQFKQNLKLAHQLGARIATVSGDDIPYQIAEYAKSRNVSKIILGRSNSKTSLLHPKASLVEKLTEMAPDMDIYIIPDRNYQPKKVHPLIRATKVNLWDLMITILILVVCTAIGIFFFESKWNEVNTVLIYILGVLIISVLTRERIYSVLSCLVSVLTFNYFFTEPRFTLNAYAPEYPLTFLIMLIVALSANSMTTRLKKQAYFSAMKSRRMEVLLETDHVLQMAKNNDEIMNASCKQIAKLLGRLIIFYPVKQNQLGEPFFSETVTEDIKAKYTSEFEHNVAAWVCQNKRSAGVSTNTLPASKGLYFAVRTDQDALAVVGIAMENKEEIPNFERSILISILNETAFALEKSVLNDAKKEIAMEAEKERLRANLLRAISHDLRTPLTSISGNADILLKNEITLSNDVRHQVYDDIYSDAKWLTNLVENLLAITKAENGNMQLALHGELMEEVINEALQHIDRRGKEHTIITKIPDDMIMAKVDPRLIIQVIINLVDNAIKYTQKDSVIEISAIKHANLVVVEVLDNGPGIADVDQEAIFDMFYTTNNETGDKRRGLGLGLALCKSIVEAHNGKIYVLDNYPKGTIFGFTLQLEEVQLHEDSFDTGGRG